MQIKKKPSNALSARRTYWYSKHGSSVCSTPRYIVTPVLEFIQSYRSKTIWCPFDTKESMYVKVLTENGFTVVHSHIDDGQDFYTYEPKKWDIMISNPPFKNKRLIFERALSFGKPFMLLMSMIWLNDSAPYKLFKDDLELLTFNKRAYYKAPDGTIDTKITFLSGYYCYKVLPRAIVSRNLVVDKSINAYN